MKSRDMGRAVGRSVLIVGLMMQSTPMAWAQLETVDPALHAAVEALVQVDPEIAGDPELAQLCRTVAEATVTDVRERAAVTNEVVTMQREGIDVATVIPTEVRETAREQFTKVQAEMQKELETLRSVDPEKAKEIELMMREGEQCMLAFESGERYTPSPEMVAHAEGMLKDWESDMVARGAPPEFVERARMEFAQWSSTGETSMHGGPGHEFGGPDGGMPSVEQMQAMGMTPEQIQMAEAYARGEMPMGQMGGTYAGPIEGHSAYMPEGWAQNQQGDFHFVGNEATYAGAMSSFDVQGGMNWEATSTGGWTSPNTGETWTQTTEGSWTSSAGETWHSSTEYTSTSGSTELKQDLQSNTQNLTAERTEFVNHVHGDGSIHQHEIHIHSDATRHDHTQEGSGL